jgi:type IV pilus assembly protein PilN
LINLLPHREAARKQRRDLFNLSMGTAFLVGGLIAGGIFLWYQTRISEQQARNQLLKTEITRLEGQIKDIAGLESEIAALRARQQAVEDLQSDRNVPVHLLTELSRQLPDGVFVSSMRQTNQSVTLQGVAQSNERVSDLLRNLARNTPWFSKPELVEIVAGSVALTPRESKRVSNFTMRVQLMRASEAEKAGAAAMTPAAGASAPAAKPAVAATAPVKK